MAFDDGERILQISWIPKRRQQADSRIYLVIEDHLKLSEVELLAALGGSGVSYIQAIPGPHDIVMADAAFREGGFVSVVTCSACVTAQMEYGGQPEAWWPRLKISEWPCTTLAALGSLRKFLACTTDPSGLREPRSL